MTMTLTTDTTRSTTDARSLGLRVRRMTIPSGELAFVDEGRRDAAPVLWLHGSPFTSLAYVRVIRGLRDARRVLAPDPPGFGQSTASPGFGGALSDYAVSIREFWGGAGPRRSAATRRVLAPLLSVA